MTEDALQRRIAQFIQPVPLQYGVNASAAGAWIGTRTGKREKNEDRALVVFATYPASPHRNFVLGVVCDGIGGMSSGDDAAVLSLSTFISTILRKPKLPIAQRLQFAVEGANDLVYRTFQGRSGSTLSAIIIENGTALGASIGDSRLYGITSTRDMKQLSRDDTMADVLGEHGDVNFYKNQLVQHIGMGDGVEPQIIPSSECEYSSILVTTDGIHGISEATFRDVSKVPSTDEEYLHRLLLLNETLGGKDNGSAIILSSNVTINSGNVSHGLILEFMSSFDHLEIWIPILGDEARHASLPREFVEASVAEYQSPQELPLPDPELSPKGEGSAKRKKSKGSRAGARKSRRGKAGNDSSPDDKDPPLEIRFPGTDES